MEHRWSTRMAVEMRVMVCHPSCGTVVGLMRDGSMDGARIEIANVRFPLHSPVTITLPLSDSDPADMVHLPAMIVRCDDGGVGVMYLDHDDATARLLGWVMRSVLTPPLSSATSAPLPKPKVGAVPQAA